MMGCQIPAFGVWNYCHDLSITQYFDAAMQARLIKRWNWNHHRGAGGEQQLAVSRSYSSRRKPTQIKVIRREVDKQHDCNGGQDTGVQAELRSCFPSSEKEVDAVCAVKRKVVTCKAVDEDLVLTFFVNVSGEEGGLEHVDRVPGFGLHCLRNNALSSY